MENITLVLETMKKAGKPLKAGEIEQLCQLPKKEVDKIMKELKKTNQIVSPKMCYWEPSK